MREKQKPSVISLFSGAMGLDLGLEQAGFEVRVVLENDATALETINLNRARLKRPKLPRIKRGIEKVETSEILSRAGLKVGEATVVVGGPCCQPFSTAGQRKSVKDSRGSLFREFIRVVNEAKPRFFVMENVRGILSAAIRHRPLSQRGPGWPALAPEERLGSAFKLVLRELKKTGYHVVYDVLNSADYGVPQIRHRVIFIGSRDGERIEMPRRTHREMRWMTLRDALKGLRQRPSPLYTEIPPKWKKYMRFVPSGGCWVDIPKRRQRWAMGKAYVSWGGRKGFFRRLAWDRPTPSLTTEPASKATLFCHPTKQRPLSVAEYKRVQQFPDDWQFSGSVSQQYVQIGNAVPVGLGRAIGRALMKVISARSRCDSELLSKVVCAREDLAHRLAHREKTTILNPTRMRRYPSLEAARDWLKRSRNGQKIARLIRKRLSPGPSRVHNSRPRIRSVVGTPR